MPESSSAHQGLLVGRAEEPPPKIIVPGARGGAPDIRKPGVFGPKPDILKPSIHIQRPDLCLAVEEFASRLSERGDLAYDHVPAEHLLLRAMNSGDLAKGYYPNVPAPNHERDDYRYVGCGPSGSLPGRDALHCGTFDAVDREMLFYLTNPQSIMVPGSAF